MKRNATGLFVAVLVLAGPARAADAPTIADVKKAWTARQDANASFRVEWVETVKYKAGAYDRFARDTPGPHPPKDTEYKAPCSFAADGDKAAGTIEGQIYFISGKTWSPYFTAGRFDGKTAMELNPLYRPGWGRVTIRSGKDRLDAGLYSRTNSPVLWVYRPLGGGVFDAFDFKKATLSDRTEKIGDVTCAEIVIKDDPAGSHCSLWCDPERGFLPIRENQRYAGGTGYDLGWEYRKDDKGRWVPTGWEYKRLDGDGAVRNTTKAEVKKLELNHKFAADAFAPIPPVSSYVNVYEDGDRKEEYLLRPDGNKRRLKTAERDKDFDELSKTNADGTPYVPAKK